MHAGIRAPRALQGGALAGEFEESLLNCALHGEVLRLPLPAAEGAAVIFNEEPVALHQEIFTEPTPRRKSAADMAFPPAR